MTTEPVFSAERLRPARPPLSRGAELLLVAVLAGAAVLPWLGRKDMWTSGEARVAQVARQMLYGTGEMRFGEGLSGWIVPKLGEHLRLEKPPLAYWLAAAASAPFGDVTHVSARLPNAIAAILVAVLVAAWAREVMGGRAGLLAGVMTVTTGVVWIQARRSNIEATLLLFTVCALWCWWRYHRTALRGAPAMGWLLGCYAMTALAALDKGPVSPPLILLVILVYLGVSGRRILPERIWHHVFGVWLLLLLTLPWTVAATLLAGRNAEGKWKTLATWGFQTQRFDAFDHEKECWYYLPKLLGDGQPWIFFALIGVAAWIAWRPGPADRDRDGDADAADTPGARPVEADGMRFYAVWALVALVFFSIPECKKSYYILPIYPALALFAAWIFERLRAGRPPVAWAGTAVRRTAQVCGAIFLAIGLALPFAFGPICEALEHLEKYAGHAPETAAVSLLAVVYGAALFGAATRRRWTAMAVATAAAAYLFFGIYVWLYPDLNRHKGDRILCRAVEPHLAPDETPHLYAFGGQPICRYYLDRHVQRILGPYDLLLRMGKRPAGERFFMAVEARDWARFRRLVEVRGTGADAFGALKAAVAPWQESESDAPDGEPVRLGMRGRVDIFRTTREFTGPWRVFVRFDATAAEEIAGAVAAPAAALRERLRVSAQAKSIPPDRFAVTPLDRLFRVVETVPLDPPIRWVAAGGEGDAAGGAP